SCIFNVRNHTRGTRCLRNVLGIIGRDKFVLRPVATFAIKHKAITILLFASAPTKIYSPKGCGLAEGELAVPCLIGLNSRCSIGRSSIMLCKTNGSDDFETLAQAFFFVRIDLVPPRCRYIL